MNIPKERLSLNFKQWLGIALSDKQNEYRQDQGKRKRNNGAGSKSQFRTWEVILSTSKISRGFLR